MLAKGKGAEPRFPQKPQFGPTAPLVHSCSLILSALLDPSPALHAQEPAERSSAPALRTAQSKAHASGVQGLKDQQRTTMRPPEQKGPLPQGCIRTAVHRRRSPPPPPWTPPFLPFQCLRLTAKNFLRRLRCQEDLRLKGFGPPSAGTIGGPWEKGGSQPTPLPPPLQTPPSPLLIHPCPALLSDGPHDMCRACGC